MGFVSFKIYSTIEIKIFFNMMCVVHYSLISTSFLRGIGIFKKYFVLVIKIFQIYSFLFISSCSCSHARFVASLVFLETTIMWFNKRWGEILQ